MERWTWKPFQCEPGEIYLSDAEKVFGAAHSGHILLEPHTKGTAGGNKSWGWARWEAIAGLLRGLPLAQMGPVGVKVLPGVKFIPTAGFRDACAVLAGARAFVGAEGGLHHAAAALGIPAVVIFGGFISPENTGYAMHRNLFTGGIACGSRMPCEHCRAAMERITPAEVEQHVREIIR